MLRRFIEWLRRVRADIEISREDLRTMFDPDPNPKHPRRRR